MQRKIFALSLIAVLTAYSQLNVQYTEQDATFKKYFFVALFAMLSNFFIEPSIVITHRPYHTKMPKSFEPMNSK